MRKRWIWVSAAIALPILVWLGQRPRPPYEWLGDVPPVDFVSPSAFGRKPSIDWKLPFAHIVYPTPRFLKANADTYAICGLLEHHDRFSSVLHIGTLKRGEFTHDLPIFAEGLNSSGLNPRMTDWRGQDVHLGFTEVLPSDRRYIGLPYAVDEAHRDVDLQIDGKTYPIRLPVTTEFGSGTARKVSSRHGDFALEISVGEWHYTIQTPKHTISAHSPKGTVVYVTDSVIGYLVPSDGRSLPVRAKFGYFYGKAVCLKEEKMRLLVTVAKGITEYRSLSGELICSAGGRVVGRAVSAFAVWSEGHWIAGPMGMSLTNGPEPTRRGANAPRDGQVVNAYVYRRLDAWEVQMDLGYPAGAKGMLPFPFWIANL